MAPGYLEAVRHLVFDALTPEDTRHFAAIAETLSRHLGDTLGTDSG